MALRVVFPDTNNKIKFKLTKMNVEAAVAIEAYARKKAKELENYMKDHRPWTDRTGAARANLSGKVSQSAKKFVTTIELAHGVDYGVYLEYSMGRRFAIIEPTIRIKGPEIVNDMKGIMLQFGL